MSDLLNNYRERINGRLEAAIAALNNAPAPLKEAMLYATTNGGKRLRPLLVYATAHEYTLPANKLDTIAAAVECIHAYSLIHDDLPAMDDDSLRRGKATTHLVYGEALAILAGDALQTLAFDLIATSDFSDTTKIKMIAVLSRNAGANGMVGGQALDILSENCAVDSNTVEGIHHLKTGALIRASVALGSLAVGLTDAKHALLDQFAQKLGLAFQLQDDLRDATFDAKSLGKNTGQDAKHHKSTYISQHGINNTKVAINTLINEMTSLLQQADKTALLLTLCTQLIHKW